MTKVLVLYVFHIYNHRVEHFIRNGIFYDENIDFMVISNDKNNRVKIPDFAKTMYRDNIGFDFGGWSEALLTDCLYKNYDKFIFVNSSVMGPYTASYFTGKWTDIYLNGLENNIKLFGSTINTIEDPSNCSHVQSYIFAMDKTTLEYLIHCEIFSMTKLAATYHEAIFEKEVLMSRKIIQNGWNIGSLLECYKHIDFTFAEKPVEDYKIPDYNDIMFPNYRGVLWNETQLVFVKGNRISIKKN